jgi:hypothetical protein
MATLDVFKLLVPETAGVADATLSQFLSLAALRMTAAEWGAVYEQAVCYLAGHILTLSPSNPRRAGGSTHAGPVSSESAGGVSRSYGSISTKTTEESTLAMTDAGRAFLELRAQNVIGMQIIDLR